MKNTIVVAVDIGGTMVRVGAITPNGELCTLEEEEIQAHRGSEQGIKKIRTLINRVVNTSRGTISGIGISCTGPLDIVQGVIHNPYTLSTWESVPIVNELKKFYDVPISLENDGDSAVLGEHWLGSGRNVKRLSAVAVGTGIAVSHVFNGELLRGLEDFHPEGGHHVIDPGGPLCYCGSHGCWESLASGLAIAREAKQQLEKGESSILVESANGNPDNINAKMVTDAARAGDPLSTRVIERAAYYTGLGIVNIAMLFMPEVVVLSGGVMKSWDLFMPAIRKALDNVSEYVPSSKMQVVRAELGYYANLYGAAYTILKGLNK